VVLQPARPAAFVAAPYGASEDVIAFSSFERRNAPDLLRFFQADLLKKPWATNAAGRAG